MNLIITKKVSCYIININYKILRTSNFFLLGKLLRPYSPSMESISSTNSLTVGMQQMMLFNNNNNFSNKTTSEYGDPFKTNNHRNSRDLTGGIPTTSYHNNDSTDDSSYTDNHFTISDDESDTSSQVRVIIDEDKIKRKITQNIEKYYQELVHIDVELQNEIDSLAKLSANPTRTSQLITILFRNQLFVIDRDTKISARLASYLWPKSKLYKHSSFASMHIFNDCLKNNNRHDTIAIFAVYYEKYGFLSNNKKRTDAFLMKRSNVLLPSESYCTTAPYYNQSNGPWINFNGNNEDNQFVSSYYCETNPCNFAEFQNQPPPRCCVYKKPQRRRFHPYVGDSERKNIPTTQASITEQHQQTNDNKNRFLYRYVDFAAIIIQNGKIIDYAIHGFVSNINEMIKKHKPRKVYINANPNDALDTFLRYPYQPFYESTYGLLTPIKIYRNPNFNTTVFCGRRNIYCAFCNVLKDAYGFFNLKHTPSYMTCPQNLHCIPEFISNNNHNCNINAPTNCAHCQKYNYGKVFMNNTNINVASMPQFQKKLHLAKGKSKFA